VAFAVIIRAPTGRSTLRRAAGQTAGVRSFVESELLEDVFTLNDFAYPTIAPPNHPLSFNIEFVGHAFPTKHLNNVERVQEYVFRHAHIYEQLGADRRYAGGIGWCAFDHNRHADFGAGNRTATTASATCFASPSRRQAFTARTVLPMRRSCLSRRFT
jgi:beta-galactosidase